MPNFNYLSSYADKSGCVYTDGFFHTLGIGPDAVASGSAELRRFQPTGSPALGLPPDAIPSVHTLHALDKALADSPFLISTKERVDARGTESLCSEPLYATALMCSSASGHRAGVFVSKALAQQLRLLVSRAHVYANNNPLTNREANYDLTLQAFAYAGGLVSLYLDLLLPVDFVQAPVWNEETRTLSYTMANSQLMYLSEEGKMLYLESALRNAVLAGTEIRAPQISGTVSVEVTVGTSAPVRYEYEDIVETLLEAANDTSADEAALADLPVDPDDTDPELNEELVPIEITAEDLQKLDVSSIDEVIGGSSPIPHTVIGPYIQPTYTPSYKAAGSGFACAAAWPWCSTKEEENEFANAHIGQLPTHGNEDKESLSGNSRIYLKKMPADEGQHADGSALYKYMCSATQLNQNTAFKWWEKLNDYGLAALGETKAVETEDGTNVYVLQNDFVIANTSDARVYVPAGTAIYANATLPPSAKLRSLGKFSVTDDQSLEWGHVVVVELIVDQMNSVRLTFNPQRHGDYIMADLIAYNESVALLQAQSDKDKAASGETQSLVGEQKKLDLMTIIIILLVVILVFK